MMVPVLRLSRRHRFKWNGCVFFVPWSFSFECPEYPTHDLTVPISAGIRFVVL